MPKKGTFKEELLKHIPFPDLPLVRMRERGKAERNEIPLRQQICPHRCSAIDWMEDFVNTSDREGRPVNLFVCADCDATLWLVDALGKEALDG